MQATHEEYAQKVKSVNPNVELIGIYEGARQKIKATANSTA